MTTRKDAIRFIFSAIVDAAMPVAAKSFLEHDPRDALIREIEDNIEMAVNEANNHSDFPLDLEKETFTVGYPIERRVRHDDVVLLEDEKNLTKILQRRFPGISIMVYSLRDKSRTDLIVCRSGEHGGIYISDFAVKPLKSVIF